MSSELIKVCIQVYLKANSFIIFIYSKKATNVSVKLHRRFVLCCTGQIYGGDFQKFCGLLRIYELYKHLKNSSGYNILKLQKDGAQ